MQSRSWSGPIALVALAGCSYPRVEIEPDGAEAPVADAAGDARIDAPVDAPGGAICGTAFQLSTVRSSSPTAAAIAMSPAGDRRVMWSTDDGTTALRWLTAPGHEQPPVVTWDRTQDISLASNDAGDAVAAWLPRKSFNVGVATIAPSRGQWGVHLLDRDALYASARVGIDALGYVVATWVEVGASAPSRDLWSLRWRVNDGSSQQPERIGSAELTVAAPPALGVSRDGAAIAIWTESVREGGKRLMANRLPGRDAPWLGPAPIAGSDGEPGQVQIAVNQDGDAVVAWTASGTRPRIRATRFTAATQSWSATDTLDDGTGYATDPRVALSADGEAIVVWADIDSALSASRIHVRATRDGAWDDATTVNQPGSDRRRDPGVAVDDDGRTVVAWIQEASTFPSLVAYVERSAGARAWSSPAFVSSPSLYAQGLLRVAAGGGGSLLVWEQQTPHGNYVCAAQPW